MSNPLYGVNWGKDIFALNILEKNLNSKDNFLNNYGSSFSNDFNKVQNRGLTENLSLPGMGGGGKSEHKTNNTVINEVINETIIENSKSAVMSMSLEQIIDIQNCQNCIIENVEMNQVGQLEARVVQDSLVDLKFATKLANDLMSKVETTKESLNFSSGSDTETNNYIRNTTHNIFKNTDFQTCAMDANAKQILRVINSKNIILSDVSMNQVLDVFVECIQKTGVVQDVINDIFTKSYLESEATQTGVIGDTGRAVGDAATGIGEGVGAAIDPIASIPGDVVSGIAGGLGGGLGSGIGDAGASIGSSISSALITIGVIIAVLVIFLVVISVIVFVILRLRKKSKKSPEQPKQEEESAPFE